MKFRFIFAFLVASLAAGAVAPHALAGEPPKQPSPTKPIFVPFDFYFRHREELGLNEEQVRELQRLADEMRDTVQTLEDERRARTQALQNITSRNSIDPARAMELFQAVLQTENEMKVIQFRNGIAMRNLLTPEQSAKLHPIASKEKAAGGSPNAGELKEKLQQLRTEISKRSGGGDVSPEVVARVEQIDQALRQGRVVEARAQIDDMLRTLRGGAGSAPLAETKPPGKQKTMVPNDESPGVKGKIDPSVKEKPGKPKTEPQPARPIDGEEVKKE